jgi:hypothetical protein
LAALYPVVVERQLDMVTVLSYRRRLKEHLLSAAAELSRLCPGLTPEDGALCLHRALLFAGILSAPTDEIGEAFLLDDDPELDIHRIDVQSELTRVIEWGLREGYRRTSQEA